MRDPKANFGMFWKDLQALRYRFFGPDLNFILFVSAFSSLCDVHHTDDLFLAICRENKWTF
jgi:hypothetical protein